MVILEALKQFKNPTDLAVFFYKNNPLEWWASIRFKDGYFCPKCGSTHVYKCKNGRYSCADCKNNFTATANTIFASTKISLSYWFTALWHLLNNANGISSHQLARITGISQKTAFYLLHKLRYLVQVHQTYIFGKQTLCSCGSYPVYNEYIDRYICPKCGKQYVSIQGKLIEENTYSNSVVSACFNLWERRNEFRQNNPNTKFDSHLNPAKGLKRLGIDNIDTETFYNISKRFENWDYSENNPTEVMIDECYLHNNPQKAKGKNRLQQYRQNISCLVIVDQYKNTLMIPYEEKKYNNTLAFTKLLQRYVGNNSIIVTDESNLYRLAGSTFVKRYNSSHSSKIFTTVVDGKTYSSNICENNVRYMKRCIVGNYNRLSVKYCDLYLAGRSFRSNNNFKATNNTGRVKAYFDLVDFDTKITIKQLSSRLVA